MVPVGPCGLVAAQDRRERVEQALPRGGRPRYGTWIDSYPFPKGDNVRQEWAAEQVGRDGFTILEAVWAPQAPAWLREVPAVQVLRRAGGGGERYHRDGEDVLWGEGKDLPPGRRRALLAL
ncbi:hypothetical protein [Streptomyces sp900105755]|uniref:Uncharacterized protein n=1 Tax=Streptomyces sp. 900105755 TaxID=3154389 RepID=A0ABV1TUV3_9ACTN